MRRLTPLRLFPVTPVVELGALLVVGEAPGVAESVPPGVRVVRLEPEELAFASDTFIGAVFDLGEVERSVLLEARRLPVLDQVPILLLIEDETAADFEWDWVDDVIYAGCAKCRLRRRLKLLLELGRYRAGARAAEPPPATSSSGVRPSSFAEALSVAEAEVKRLHQLLGDRRSFDDAVLDGVEVGIATTDEAGEVGFLNRFGRDLLGLGSENNEQISRILGLEASPSELLGMEARTRVASVLGNRVGGDLDLEILISRAEGEAQGQLGFFFIFRDVAPEKRMEMERDRLERLAAMGTMVAGFAHEIRNPVASLRSLAESLNEELADSVVRLSHADRMLKVLARVERLVDTWLQFGRPRAPNRALFRPATLLTGAVVALAPRTRAMGGDFRVEIESQLPDALVDEAQLTQVLVILLDNALDAAGSPAKIVFRATSQRTQDPDSRRRSQPPPPTLTVRFEVCDEGPGIAPEILSRVFDPFFSTKPTGIGLGLSIAHQLVHENGGRLEVSSLPGGPTTFSVIVCAEPMQD